jgi:hypothetical protein
MKMKNIIIIILAFSLIGCKIHNPKNDLNNKLIKISKIVSNTNQPFTFHLDSLTNFNWDHLFIFGPYTYSEDIDSILGFSWNSFDKYSMEYNEGHFLLVFTLNQKVIYDLIYSRKYGDFNKIKRTIIKRKDAIFTLKKDYECKVPWLNYYITRSSIN